MKQYRLVFAHCTCILISFFFSTTAHVFPLLNTNWGYSGSRDNPSSLLKRNDNYVVKDDSIIFARVDPTEKEQSISDKRIDAFNNRSANKDTPLHTLHIKSYYLVSNNAQEKKETLAIPHFYKQKKNDLTYSFQQEIISQCSLKSTFKKN